MTPRRAIAPALGRAAMLAQRPLADPVAGLLAAMRSAGIEPADPGEICADGVLRRFCCESDKPGTRNGWAVLHADHGAGGSWKSGVTCSWSSKAASRMTKAEKDAFYTSIRQAKAEAQRQREAEQSAAAERASMLWAKAAPAKPEHPYLARKRIAPGNARQSGDLLVLRIGDVDGKTHSLQYIGPDGGKRLLTDGAKRGHFVMVAGALPAGLIVIAEGFATAMTVATQFPGACTLAAIDAGNLEPVAVAIRAKCPGAQIVIAADDDRLTPGNPGLMKARAAAAAVGGKLVKPVWPDGAPESLSDFNDLAVYMVEAAS
jgi:putative DNA primase/helicase